MPALRLGVTAVLASFAAPALVYAGCNVRMFEGLQWITCFAGSTACTTVWDGSTLVVGPVCEKVVQPT